MTMRSAASIPPRSSPPQDRLHRLRLQGPLDPVTREGLACLAALATDWFRVPICLVSAIDGEVQTVLASCGATLDALPAATSPCALTLAGNEPLLVNDCVADPRLQSNPYVAGDFGLRFYAGVPLRDPQGEPFGTLCLLDRESRHDIDAQALGRLTALGRWVSDDLERRRQLLAERDLFADGPLAAVVWSSEAGWPLRWQSGNLAQVLGDDLVARLAAGAGFETLIDPRDRLDFRTALRSHAQAGLRRVEVSYRLLGSPERSERWVRQVSCMDDDWQADGPVLRGYLSDETRAKRLESAMASAKERLHLAIESAQLGTFDLDLDRGTRIVDSRGAEIIGLRLEELDVSTDFWLDRVHPFDRAHLAAGMAGPAGVDEGFRTKEYRIRHRLGHYVWVQSFAKVVERRSDGSERRLVGTLLDITERRREELTRNRQRQLLDVLNRAQATFLLKRDMHEACDGLFQPLLKLTGSQFGFIGVMDREDDGRPCLVLPTVSNLSWNEGTRRLYESRLAAGSIGMKFHDLDNLFGHVVTHDTVVLTNDPSSHAASRGLPPGHPPLDSFLGLPIRFNGRVTGMIGLGNCPDGYDHDLVEILEPLVTTLGALFHARELETARQRAEAELQRMVTTDALTGLPNRRRLVEAAEAALARSARNLEPLALAVLDLDHFKQVNDGHGHAAGDAVLRHVAAVASAAVREADVLARQGGEEFALLLHDTDAAGAWRVVERLREALATSPVRVADQMLTVTLSAGVSCWREGDTLDALMARADAALYRAKANGRNRVEMAGSAGAPLDAAVAA
jgi:diguanylate cyclase (GGDEF)-like protein/PAS domain S-box-containing protein